MSGARSVLCPHCGRLHDGALGVCPATGRPIVVRGTIPRVPQVPSPIPAAGRPAQPHQHQHQHQPPPPPPPRGHPHEQPQQQQHPHHGHRPHAGHAPQAQQPPPPPPQRAPHHPGAHGQGYGHAPAAQPPARPSFASYPEAVRGRASAGKTAVANPFADRSGRNLFGKTIGGKYLVRSILGEGGMGTVYEAEHIAIGRPVALKILHPTQVRKKVAVKRFYQEARAAGAIGHPNICEVYDLGELEDGSPYLVMERLVGRTLADRIANEGGLPFDDVIDVVVQVLSGLVAAHDKGIAHRDIKPENVFLTDRVGIAPVAKILDFGVSKVFGPTGDEEELHLTRTGMVMGTPFYMSPEQARGDRDLDARVDLYASGVILYEALTGRRPFIAANYNALLLQILTGTPRAVRELRPGLPAGFDRVIEKAMARSRSARYQTALEFQRDLQQLRERYAASLTNAGVPVAVTPITPAAFAQRAPSGASARRYREDIPKIPQSTSSIDIQIDFDAAQTPMSASGGTGFEDDDAPTEIARPPALYGYDDDEDNAAETEVRQDALDLIRQARTGARRSAPQFNPDETVKMDRPDDVTQIMREARDRLRAAKKPRR